ncbi:hypothetical protein MKEN_00630600 [Mycena kentingensis (nom. inval.)]|nr:hypothetical protein MKEN_00630600 [Mycena kentingensis (nom. inval.)]
MRAWFSRAGALPLSISLQCTSQLALPADLVAYIASLSARWGRLEIRGSLSSQVHIILAVPGPHPLLERGSPGIQFPATKLPRSSARVLSLDARIPVAVLEATLARFPRLCHLVLRGAVSGAGTKSDGTGIVLPGLRAIDTDLPNLAVLTLPDLLLLSLTCTPAETMSSSDLGAFLARSSCLLTSFELRIQGSGVAGFQNILSAVPTIVSLRLSLSQARQIHDLSLLVKHHCAGSGSAIPLLETVAIEVDTRYIHEEHDPELLRGTELLPSQKQRALFTQAANASPEVELVLCARWGPASWRWTPGARKPALRDRVEECASYKEEKRLNRWSARAETRSTWNRYPL